MLEFSSVVLPTSSLYCSALWLNIFHIIYLRVPTECCVSYMQLVSTGPRWRIRKLLQLRRTSDSVGARQRICVHLQYR